MNYIQRLASCALILLISTSTLLAQTVTGSITGVITDQTGAVVPKAEVTAENTATGVKTREVTNNTGTYTIRFLPVGSYRITVSSQGFSTQTVPVFALEINQTAKIDASLQPGNTTNTVEVNETATPILNTNDASLGITLTTNEIANFPLNGGNFSSVTLFQPGAVSTDPQGFTGNNAIERSTYNNGIASINGNRNQANNYTLDGADQNEPQNNLIAYNPAPEALAEVRVVSANAPATYGNANGGAVVSILKSGGSNFHGSAYGAVENYNLDANTWANKFSTPIIPRNPYTQSRFGGTLGGPILRDKLFFFVDYLGNRRHSGGLVSASVLSGAMRNGDFSALLSQGDNSIQLYDTQNNFAPYPGNTGLPVVSKVAAFLIAHPELYPLPNAAPTDGLLQNDYQGSQRKFVINDQGDVKIDWNAGDDQQVHRLLRPIERSRFVDRAHPGHLPLHQHLSEQARRRQLDSYVFHCDCQ